MSKYTPTKLKTDKRWYRTISDEEGHCVAEIERSNMWNAKDTAKRIVKRFNAHGELISIIERLYEYYHHNETRAEAVAKLETAKQLLERLK